MSLRGFIGWVLIGIGFFSSEANADRIDVRSTFEPMERQLFSAYGWDRTRRAAKPGGSPEGGASGT
ncbi:MAG: hypothetical protein J7M27_00410, partial [Candidatus Latescibacteria bacterium]|nr:hypothetical protein [Candidatus Latescibacterota bacterium]